MRNSLVIATPSDLEIVVTREVKAPRRIWRHEDGREMGMRGTYRQVASPDRLAQTELFEQDWTGGAPVAELGRAGA